MDKNKYFSSKSIELMRSQIHPSGYNPRQISDEGRKQLKRSIKKYGVVGGIVVNRAYKKIHAINEFRDAGGNASYY